MSIWCNACQCHVRTPCTSHDHLSEDQQRASSLCRRLRSTKGASKARRDHINHEIRNMRALLPITAEDQERLSYLHSMAAICTYIRKSVLFQGLASKEEPRCSLPYEAFLQALHGFVLVTTAQGRLVYVSENVVEYLGIAMVDVLQGDSLYDMVERSDIDIVKSNLDFHSNSSPERSFVCSMQTSKAFKLQNGSCSSMLVRGSFQFFPQPSSSSSSSCPVSEPLFVSVCSPTVNRIRTSDSQFCHMFNSVHRLDMSFSQVSDSVLFYLGYSSDELTNNSWYSLIYPEDLSLSADSHKSLVQADEGCKVQMVIRLQCKDLSRCWVYIRANKEAQSINCANYVISETEARFLRQKLTSEALAPADHCSSHHPNSKTSKCLKRQGTYSSQSDEPCARKRRDSEMEQSFALDASSQGDFSPVPTCESPAMFTPPYTPSSASSSLSHDLLVDHLLSSPEPSPPYYSYPQATLTCGQSPSQSPLTLDAEPNYDQSPLGPLSTHSPLSSPSYDFPACTPDARLVPDAVSDICESPIDCTLHQDDFLEQPHGGGLVHHLHNVPEHALPINPSLLTPSQSPTSQNTFEFSERERVEISILAQQIKTLANSFDMLHTFSPVQNAAQTSLMNGQVFAYTWPQHAPLTSAPGFKCELVLDDCVFDSILNELDLVTRKSSSPDNGVSAFSSEQRSRSVSCQQEAALGLSPDIPEAADQLTSGGISMDQNNGLHQLNHYIHSSLQQDGLTEENLY